MEYINFGPEFMHLERDELSPSKCGEVFVSKHGKFSFGCSLCGLEFENSKFFGHILEEHLRKIKNAEISDSSIDLLLEKDKNLNEDLKVFKKEPSDSDDEVLLDYHSDESVISIKSILEDQTITVPIEDDHSIATVQNNPIKIEVDEPKPSKENITSYKNNNKFRISSANKQKQTKPMKNHKYRYEKTEPKESTETITAYKSERTSEDFDDISNTSHLFICELCKKTFINSYELKIHRKTFCGFRCIICAEEFFNKSDFGKHKKIHNNSDVHLKEEKTRKKTRKKKITDEKERYQCDRCGKKYSLRSSLRRHILAHKGVRNYDCDICKLKFSSNSHLIRHIATHTGEKPHKCPKCGKDFAQRYNMLSHLKKMHEKSDKKLSKDKKVLKCKICNENFLNENSLEEHEKCADSCVQLHSLVQTTLLV